MLSAEEITQFTELAKKFEPAQLDAMKGIVQTHLHPVFQAINDGGRAAANADNKVTLKAAEDAATAASNKATELEGKLAVLQQSTPELAKLTLAHEQQVAALTTAHAKALADKDAAIITAHTARVLSELTDELASETLKVDPEYARTVVINKPEVKARIKVGADGSYTVLQKGQQELTITPAEGRTAIQHLAEELAGTIEDRWKVSGVTRGPGVGGAGAGGSAFDGIRKSVADQNARAAATPQATGAARLRGERPVAVK